MRCQNLFSRKYFNMSSAENFTKSAKRFWISSNFSVSTERGRLAPVSSD